MFSTDLSIELVAGSDSVWRLKAPLVFGSKYIGRVEVPALFYTDLASVPRIPFVYSAFGATAHREGVLHDYLFRKDSTPVVSFSTANKVMLEAMVSRGKPWYIRWPVYLGVSLGGKLSYHRRLVSYRFGAS